ncbi:MAG: hypothetical protein HY700_07930 [Gemmatimonadetes bacterium]|nr:hypothetical protein [Gemmatimonadota bacterium]
MPQNSSLHFAGVDAGGSHSEVVIVDRELRVLARVRGGAAALRPDNAREVAGGIAVTLGRARSEIGIRTLEAVVVAAAGGGRAAERKALTEALEECRVAGRIAVVGDGEAALESAFGSKPGIVLVSGTGSIAYARDAAGAVRRTGGLGWQLGDEGSGYALGRAALGAAGRAADGRGPATSLLERIQSAALAADLEELIRWAQTASRADIAALAETACDAALEGDPVARELVESTASDLCAHVIALLRQVDSPAPTDIALAGGLLAPESPVRNAVVTGLGRVAPALRVVNVAVDPALGAATLAARL